MNDRESSLTSNVRGMDVLCIDTMRMLAIDAVQRAKSGHPGTPLDASPTVYCLWQRYLRYAPEDPHWINRDRFVLSNGHASAMLYALLHLAEVKAASPGSPGAERAAVTMDDLKTFRQANSRCTGHPEYGTTAGVEATTGPLGQGVANSVGMAIASRWLGATFNRPDLPLFDFNVYTLCSDGDMMEGIASEAASLAGHLELGNLCWIYDANRITIEGSTGLAFTEDVAARFRAYRWNVVQVDDANDLDALARAFETFAETRDRPTLIVVHSHIGYGSPHKHDSAEAHGEPLGVDEVRLTKEFYGWDPDAQFHVPEGVREHFRAHLGARGQRALRDWRARFDAYRQAHPELAAQIDRLRRRELPPGLDAKLPAFAPDPKGLATRESSGKVLNAIAAQVPWLVGGAADLAPSTKTRLVFDSSGDFEAPDRRGRYEGRNFHFGLREHAMAAIANGLALADLRPFASTFLIFSDYCRPALRLSAMMRLPVIYVFTHDSIALGEDGPTHQPIEQLASLRAMPGMITLRPADANEVIEAWRIVMALRDRPACLILTRQPVPTLDRTRHAAASGVARGAYVLADAGGTPDVLLIGTGSEVALCVEAYERLRTEGIRGRVVSMPSWELFEEQSASYRESVLPARIGARVAVEAGSSMGWERYAGIRGTILGMETFGMSAPAGVVAERFGFDAGHVVAAAKAQLANHRSRARGKVASPA